MKLIIFDFSGVLEELSRLELRKIFESGNSGNIFCIVSYASTSSIKNILEREGVANFFKDVLGGDLGPSKAAKIKMLLEKYKIAPEDAVYITDTSGDIIEARECGIKSIAVTWGFHEQKTLEKAKPAKIVSTPEDLLKAIEEN